MTGGLQVVDRVSRRASHPMPAAAGILRRKCACGGHAGEQCAACKDEQEAVLRRSPAGSGARSEIPSIVHGVLQEPGQPLDPSTQTTMGLRLGHDFSGVRVHADDRAAASARAVNALAYTVGEHIVFGPNQFDQASRAGQSLLAHELQHTIQQAVRPDGTLPLSIGDPHDAAEVEAERASQDGLEGTGHPPHERTGIRLSRAPSSAPPAPTDVFVHNTELGGLSVGNFDFHLKNCTILVWVWLKFKFGDDITVAERTAYKHRFVDAVHRTWAHTGYSLSGTAACPCRSIPIEIHCEENAGSFYHKLVDVEKKHDVDRRPKVISDINVNLFTPDDTLGHEFGHVLGLYDEYDGGFFENLMFWHKNRPEDPAGLMNVGTELRPRYFEQYRRQAQKTTSAGCTYTISSPTPPV